MIQSDVLVHEAINNGWKSCIYGLGRYGKNLGVYVLEILGLYVDYVTDRDEVALAKVDLANEKKISVEELLSLNEDCYVLVCCALKHQFQIANLLSNNKRLHFDFIHNVIKIDSVINKYYGVEIKAIIKPKIAVFTCVTGGYDNILEPKYISTLCDYYVISDVPVVDSVYRFIPIADVVPEEIKNPKDQNRYCKMHGYKIFNNYRASIYVDGSIEIIGDNSTYMNNIGYSGLAMLKHPWRDCIYEEGIIVASAERTNKEGTIEQMRCYANEGMPRHYGLFECGVIVCDHETKMAQEILEKWYEEYMKMRLRDQYALPYILWKMKLPYSVIGVVDDGKDVRKSEIAIKRIDHD